MSRGIFLKFKIVISLLIVFNIGAVLIFTSKFKHDHASLARINSFDVSAVERKLVGWGAFSPAEAGAIVPMQQRYIESGDIRRSDIDILLQVLRSPAPVPTRRFQGICLSPF